MIFRLKEIQVKNYVKAYYEKHGFGPDETKMLTALLSAPSMRFDEKIPEAFVTLVPFSPVISDTIVMEHGNQLSKTCERIFANYLDGVLKRKFEFAIELEILFCESTGQPFEIKTVLERVRNNILKLDEDDLLLESITKHIQRYCKRNNISYEHVKKRGGSVLRTPLKTLKNLPQGYMWLKDWLKLANTSPATFRRKYRNELHTRRVGKELAVRALAFSHRAA